MDGTVMVANFAKTYNERERYVEGYGMVLSVETSHEKIGEIIGMEIGDVSTRWL